MLYWSSHSCLSEPLQAPSVRARWRTRLQRLIQTFCRGCPGWMCRMVTPCFSARFSSVSLIYAGPVSTRTVPGLPRHSMILSKYEEGQKTIWEIVFPTIGMTLSAGKEKSTSMPSPSRLKSSGTFSNRNALPSPRRSAMKSIDQVMFGASGTANASGFSRFNQWRGVRHCHSGPMAFHGSLRRFGSSSQ